MTNIDPTAEYQPPTMDTPMRMEVSRRAAGRTVNDMAALMNISKQMVGRYESGAAAPSRDQLMWWGYYNETPLWWLLGEDRCPSCGARSE